jgi:hypothetical protein
MSTVEPIERREIEKEKESEKALRPVKKLQSFSPPPS